MSTDTISSRQIQQQRVGGYFVCDVDAVLLQSHVCLEQFSQYTEVTKRWDHVSWIICIFIKLLNVRIYYILIGLCADREFEFYKF